MPELPPRPSAEHLRKDAKRLARANGIRLAAAQRALAQSYGYRSWAALMRAVDDVLAAPRDGDLARRDAALPMLAAVRAGDVERVRALLADGVNPRIGDGHDLPLHLAARRGDRELVETLIAGGALGWQTDGEGRTALEAAKLGTSPERDAIVALLDRTIIADPSFAAAVEAIHAGDAAALDRLLTARPSLLHERNVGPGVYRMAKRSDYFRDPKLFWFIANNPNLVERLPDTIVDVAEVMLRHGVEQGDLDYTMGLLMSSGAAGPHKIPLMRVLMRAGAVVDRGAILATAAHWELEPLRELVVNHGLPYDALLAAAFGDTRALAQLLPQTPPADVQLAFGLAVINRRLEAAKLALDAGADVNAFLPVHSHSTALHQAAAHDDPEMIAFLLERGARPDIRDTLWSGTPLGWARFGGHTAAIEALERAGAP
jgi:Ankyrin repeats (3 copies)/Ankyrin repeats (many copies)